MPENRSMVGIHYTVTEAIIRSAYGLVSGGVKQLP